MKSQMKFQKILTLLTLIIAAWSFVYALIFISGNLSNIAFYHSKQAGVDIGGVDEFCDLSQTFVGMMITICIIFIVIVVLLYITSTNSRRNYYVTNYVSVGLVIGIAVVVALIGIIFMCMLMAKFYGVDWEGLQAEINNLQASGDKVKEVSQSPLMFILGIVTYLLVAASSAAWVYNLIWKIKLMRGEKALLENGLNKEVA